ncbi:mechanosensitive ion channel family protein [Natronogracilivirga saccharolytica]|uniref:Mechanosensitive ion channel n=1 Tax=Natronogracilivirga saccharolytica TaxID=2812953 RepID=A0A8J7UTP4_9BACT|nr:mechanosensitive ion channel domain-containing protein [Natronogracilivirga saccharolytica]MBP3192801.1 mechanosensitive ion channel [Natronogracilivirga saccharolytica]
MGINSEMGEVAEMIVEEIVPYGLNVLGAIVILIVGWLVASWVSKRVFRACDKSERIDNTLSPLIAKAAKIIILFATLIAVLGQFGIETASLVALLGVAGLAIGLALQGTLSNVASGVMLLTFRPFNVGDFIDAGGTMGIVDEIGLFTTKMHTLDNVYLLVPNSNIWGANIKNFSRNELRRVDMVFGISYSDDIDKAFEIIQEALDADERVLKDPEPLLAVGELGNSSVDLLVRPWTKGPDWWATRLALTKDIKQRFDKGGITIPFPQRDVHLFQKNGGK